MAFQFPSLTTVDKALVTATGFVIIIGGLALEYADVIHLSHDDIGILTAVVGVATTISTYLAKGPAQAKKEIAARKARRSAPRKKTKPVVTPPEAP